MSEKIKSISIRCHHCGHRFPSMIGTGDVQTFQKMLMAGNTQVCPKCLTIVACNKENMSYVLADDSGGSVGPEFGKS